jgi:secreted trypsin-like serine protease
MNPSRIFLGTFLYTLVRETIVVAGTDVPENRRLILNGEVADMSDHPFAVALLICSLSKSGSIKRKSCYHFCTGTLIAPDVILTAGHCVVDDSTAFNDGKPVTDLRRVRASLGTSDVLKRSKGSSLIPVRDYANAGYNTNYHFPMDNDVGLFFLSDCLSPEKWSFATIPTPIRSLDDSCQNATVIGWGKHKSVPDQLYKSDGKLRSYVDRVQPYAVCRESYVDLHNGKVYKGLKQSIPYKELHNTISPDRHICHGGNTPSASCFGDSGGPITVDDPVSGRPVIIGVTSFGPTTTCGATPGYAARVSTYALWIHSMIVAKSTCVDKFDISSIFTSYPVIDRRQSPTDRTGRCGTGQWQCEYSGSCIPARNVCDGYPQCDDESDESEHVCLGNDNAANTENIPPAIQDLAESMGFRVPEATAGEMDIDGPSAVSDVPGAGGDDADSVAEDDLTINTRLYSKWRAKADGVAIHFSECPAAFELIQHVRDNHCKVEYRNVVNGVKRAGDNPRAVVPKALLDSCEKLNHCIGESQSTLLIGWIKHCIKAPLPSLTPPDWIRSGFQSHITLCQDAQDFVDEEAQRIPTAMRFARKYDRYCPAMPASPLR